MTYFLEHSVKYIKHNIMKVHLHWQYINTTKKVTPPLIKIT